MKPNRYARLQRVAPDSVPQELDLAHEALQRFLARLSDAQLRALAGLDLSAEPVLSQAPLAWLVDPRTSLGGFAEVSEEHRLAVALAYRALHRRAEGAFAVAFVATQAQKVLARRARAAGPGGEELPCAG